MNTKGVSVIISYITLMIIVLILGGVSYNVITSYVFKDIEECPDGVSLYVKESNCNSVDLALDLTLYNDGLFNIGGYFIHATNKNDQELATQDLSQKITEGGTNIKNYVIFTSEGDNPMTTYDEMKNTFNMDNEIYSIEIIPIRFQKEDDKLKLASCGNAKIKKVISCNFYRLYMEGLVSWWDFEENLNDQMGINSGEIFGANCNVAGKVGQACEFMKDDGDYINVPDSVSLDIT